MRCRGYRNGQVSSSGQFTATWIRKRRLNASVFSFKHPFAAAMLKQIRGMVPHQDGPVAEAAGKRHE